MGVMISISQEGLHLQLLDLTGRVGDREDQGRPEAALSEQYPRVRNGRDVALCSYNTQQRDISLDITRVQSYR